ncbi:unnamed protein product [Ectocarpus sp. 12 AP-2014]
MAPQLPISRDWGGDNETIPLPVVISPEQPRSAELEAGTEGFSPDRLLRQAKRPIGALEISPQPPPPPPPPPPRGAPWYCCSSDPKEQQRMQQQCTGRVCLALRCCCCLFGVGLALLVAYWSLVPMCTTCGVGVSGTLSSSSSAVGGVEVASMEGSSVGYDVQPFSTLHINQLQVYGTHNSYHRRTNIPGLSKFWKYEFPSIPAQLDAGVRHLELDVHYDWKTGRWFVYHISVVDALSSCHCLLSCLQEIRAWSDLNPMHHVIFMDIEMKLTGDFLRICGDHTPDQDRAAFRSLQDTILEAFPPERLVTPSMVQGDYASLFEAVNAGGSCVGGRCGSSGEGRAVPGVAGGWPLVDDTRGMILFVMDYQTVNLRCRDGVRKALPVGETVFFERIPKREVADNVPYAAFTQTCQCGKIWEHVTTTWANRGLMIRQDPRESWVVPGADRLTPPSSGTGNETYLAETAAQLLVSDDVTRGVAKGVCRSRCSPMVPAEECVLEGFC